MSLDRRRMVLVNAVSLKQNVRLQRDWSIGFSMRSDCGGDPQRDVSGKKGEGVWKEVNSIFPDPLLQRRPTTGLQLSADRDY